MFSICFLVEHLCYYMLTQTGHTNVTSSTKLLNQISPNEHLKTYLIFYLATYVATTNNYIYIALAMEKEKLRNIDATIGFKKGNITYVIMLQKRYSTSHLNYTAYYTKLQMLLHKTTGYTTQN